MVKSQQEIDLIKLGAATADVGGAACSAALSAAGQTGMMEWEVARSGVQAMYQYISDNAGDRAELLDTWVWFQSGINTDGAHNPLTITGK